MVRLALALVNFSRGDGRKYKGQWVDGKQHGKGAFISNNGEQRNGLWENGVKIKWIYTS